MARHISSTPTLRIWSAPTARPTSPPSPSHRWVCLPGWWLGYSASPASGHAPSSPAASTTWRTWPTSAPAAKLFWVSTRKLTKSNHRILYSLAQMRRKTLQIFVICFKAVCRPRELSLPSFILNKSTMVRAHSSWLKQTEWFERACLVDQLTWPKLGSKSWKYTYQKA